MFGEIGIVSSPQTLVGGSNTKIKPQAQESFVKADSVVTSDETFFSPVIKIDKENQTAILQFRDSETGEVTKEYPSESVKAYEPVERKAEPVAVEASEKPAKEEPAEDILV